VLLKNILHLSISVFLAISFVLFAWGCSCNESKNQGPPASTNLEAAAVSFDKIALSWSDTSQNETGFEIERSMDGTSFTLTATLPTDTTALTDAGLNAKTTYWYRMRAYNPAGYSDYSNVTWTTTYPFAWARTYGGSYVDGWISVRQTSDGGFIVAGMTTVDIGFPMPEAWVLKLDKYGGVAWQKAYGEMPPFYNYAYSIQPSADGGYIVAGMRFTIDIITLSLYTNPWLIKLSGDGTPTWQNTYSRFLTDTAFSVQQTSDGGFIVAGATYSNTTDFDAWLLKLDPDGMVSWQKAYGGPLTDMAYSVQQTNDGGYIVAGATYSTTTDIDAWILKLDTNGMVSWQKAYGGPFTDMAYSFQQTNDGGFIVAGVYSLLSSGENAWVMKLNPDGSESWQRMCAGSLTDGASSVQQTSDGGFIVVGSTESFGAGNGDVWASKLDPDGTVAWQRTFGGPFTDMAYMASSVQQTVDGGYIIVGFTESFGAGTYDAWAVRLDSNGSIRFNPSSGAVMADATAVCSTISTPGTVTNASVTTTTATPISTFAIATDTNAIIQQQAP